MRRPRLGYPSCSISHLGFRQGRRYYGGWGSAHEPKPRSPARMHPSGEATSEEFIDGDEFRTTTVVYRRQARLSANVLAVPTLRRNKKDDGKEQKAKGLQSHRASSPCVFSKVVARPVSYSPVIVNGARPRTAGGSPADPARRTVLGALAMGDGFHAHGVVAQTESRGRVRRIGAARAGLTSSISELPCTSICSDEWARAVMSPVALFARLKSDPKERENPRGVVLAVLGPSALRTFSAPGARPLANRSMSHVYSLVYE